MVTTRFVEDGTTSFVLVDGGLEEYCLEEFAEIEDIPLPLADRVVFLALETIFVGVILTGVFDAERFD